MSEGAAARGGLIRQGDVLLLPVEGIPTGEGVIDDETTADRHVLAEGEATGHAHVVAGVELRLVEWRQGFRWGRADRRTYLVVAGKDATLTHDEHLPLT